MKQFDERERENEALRELLSRMSSEATLRISENMNPDKVLQEILDNGRALASARYGGITTLDESERLLDFITSGFTPEEHQRMLSLAEWPRPLEYLRSTQEPLRLRDAADHTRSLGFPEGHPQVKGLMGTPMRHLGEHVGNLYVADKEGERDFTQEDEDTLVMFASQAAMVIANARRYRDEQRARASLETLIDTSPVGVVVFDAKTGTPLSFNREARRIVDGLRDPDQSPERLLDVLTIRRGDGREVSLAELPLARALGSGETVRAEEMVMRAPDGRSDTVLVNTTPIRPEEGEVESFVVTLQDMTPLAGLNMGLNTDRMCQSSGKSDAVMGTMAGRRAGMSGPATSSNSSGSLKQGSIWKARQASSRRSSEPAAMVWWG